MIQSDPLPMVTNRYSRRRHYHKIGNRPDPATITPKCAVMWPGGRGSTGQARKQRAEIPLFVIEPLDLTNQATRCLITLSTALDLPFFAARQCLVLDSKEKLLSDTQVNSSSNIASAPRKQAARRHVRKKEIESHHITVGRAPAQRPELHDTDETAQIEHLPLQILAMPHAAEIEQLGACMAGIVINQST